MNKTSYKELTEIDPHLAECHLFLHNDDVHSFEYVAGAVTEATQFQPLQVEQIVLIAHNSGKAHVKMGSWEQIHPMHAVLERRGLIAEIKKEFNG
jgi:ATP-dependent Clp protease adapter protein ClpS